MYRLTFEGNFCDISQCEATPGGSYCESGACSQRKVWERLKEYEDTGVEPEALKHARQFEDGLNKGGYSVKRMVELMEADRDGRLVVLPCKATPDWQLVREQRRVEFWKRQYEGCIRLKARVGDTLWLTASYYNGQPPEPIAAHVTRIMIGDGDAVTYVTDKRRIGDKDIGKTVFLNKGEAENVLEAAHGRS